MKRFTVHATGENTAEWLDSGFAAFTPGTGEEGRSRRPDVLLAAADDWPTVAELWPKVVVIRGAATPTAELAEDYRCRRWRDHTILTRLEGQLHEPEWVVYNHAAKAVAGAVYRHLLADVFRETREWCGHTFSVLGR